MWFFRHFSRHICSTVAETIGVTSYAARFGAKNFQKTTFEAVEMMLSPWNQQDMKNAIRNISSASAYGVCVPQLIHYALCCSNYSYFLSLHRALVTRLLSQGYLRCVMARVQQQNRNVWPCFGCCDFVWEGITVIFGMSTQLQSVSWSLAEFRHNKIVQSPNENYFNVCRQHKEKWDLVKMTIIQTGW